MQGGALGVHSATQSMHSLYSSWRVEANAQTVMRSIFKAMQSLTGLQSLASLGLTGLQGLKPPLQSLTTM